MTRVCECEGVLTLEAGSTFACAGDLSTEFSICGGTVTWHSGKQVVRIDEPVAVIGIPKASGELRPMDLSLRLPSGTPAGTYRVVVSQRNTAGQTVGGVTFNIDAS